ncbi:MAG TPA: polysaccharide deacetylase family protein [bacterium]|nr:polysaccharide deacetylase family protein [bacterium]
MGWLSAQMAGIFRRYECPVFQLHHVGVFSAPMSLSPQQFQLIMQSLKDLGCTTLSLEDYIDQLDLPRRPDQRQMVLTCDDALVGVYENAWPILREFGFQATIFLPTDFIGGRSEWMTHIPGASQIPLLSWAQVEEMSKDPLISFGTQTNTHPDLTQVSPQRCHQEIKDSCAEIQEKLGIEAKTLVYPFGRFNDRVLNEVKQAGLLGACTDIQGVRNQWRDRFQLKRVSILPTSSPRSLQMAFSPSFRALRG